MAEETAVPQNSKLTKYGIQYGVLLCVMSWGMMNTVNATYWQYFMTNVAFISTATVAVIMTISSTFDIFAVPISGIMIEKIKLPWGKYPSWLIVGPLIVAVFFIFCFINYGLDDATGLIVYSAAYCLATLGINTMITAQNMAINLGSTNPTERAVLAAKKGQGSSLAGFVFGVIGLPIILFFNGGTQDAPAGYLALLVILGAFMFGCFFFLFVMLRRKFAEDEAAGIDKQAELAAQEAAKLAEQADAEKLSFGDMIKALFMDGPLLAIVFGDGFRYIGRASMLGLLAYYFKYVIGDPSGTAMFLSMSGIVALLGAILTEVLVHKFQKRTMYLCGMFIMFGCYIVMYFFGNTTWGFTVIGAVWYIGLAFVNSTQLGLYSDAVDYGVWKYKKNCRGWLMAIAGFPPKMGNLGRAFVVGFGLAIIGFNAKVDPTPEVVEGIRAIMCVIPAVIFLAGILLVIFGFRLDDKKMEVVQADLKAWGLANNK